MLSGNAIKHYSEFFNLDLLEKLPKKQFKRKDIDLWIADPHCPYHHKELLDKTIQENTDCKHLVIVGDWFDMYTKTRFRMTKDVNFRDEFRRAYWKLKETATYFDSVDIILSNHDERFRKWLFDHLPATALEFVHQTLVQDLIKLIPNIKIITHNIQGKREIGYIVQRKNAVFTHVEKSAKDVSKTVQEVEKDLQRWQSVFKLKDYNMVVQAHNHQSGKVKFDSKYLFQIPCLIDITEFAFDYVFSGKLQGNPPALGYIRAELNNKGFYDHNKTNIVNYDV